MVFRCKKMLMLFAVVLLFCNMGSLFADPDWSISGEYFEGCTCNPGCPCLFGSEPTYDRKCEISGVFYIKKGKYGEIDLGNQTVIGITDLTAKPEKNWIVFYINGDNDSGVIEKALLDIFQNHVFGFAKVPPERTTIRYLPIFVESSMWRKRAIVAEHLTLDLEILHGNGDDNKPTQIVNKHFPVWAKEFDDVLNMGRMVAHHFREDSKEWNYDGRSGFATTFIFSSK